MMVGRGEGSDEVAEEEVVVVGLGGEVEDGCKVGLTGGCDGYVHWGEIGEVGACRGESVSEMLTISFCLFHHPIPINSIIHRSPTTPPCHYREHIHTCNVFIELIQETLLIIGPVGVITLHRKKTRDSLSLICLCMAKSRHQIFRPPGSLGKLHRRSSDW